MEHGREGDYGGKKGRRVGFMRERKIFLDNDKGLKADETDERVIFVTFVMISSLSSLTGA